MIFQAIKSHNPSHIALKDERETVSYDELEMRIYDHAKKLENVDVLAIDMDNCVEWVLWDLAALHLKIPSVPIPPFFTSSQVAHVVKTAGVTHIITKDGLKETGLKSAHKKLNPKTAKITFTSGSTGEPKGVCLSKTAMCDVAHSIKERIGSSLTGMHLCVLPLAILLENVAGVYTALIAGCPVYLPSLNTIGDHYQSLHTLIKTHQISSLILVPELLRILMFQVQEKETLPSLKFIAVGGSKVDAELLQKAHDMKLPVYEGYGLSECASVVAMNDLKNHQNGTAGKLLSHIKASIRDSELFVKNTGFLGYIGEDAPEEIATGDLASIDKNDYISIIGRKKNVLITSYGRNISPEWVEAKLLANPSIFQTIVYGDGEPALSAYIVSNKSSNDLQKIIDEINTTLPSYAHIKHFDLVPPFSSQQGTLTGNGRPKRHEILKLYQSLQQEKKHGIL